MIEISGRKVGRGHPCFIIAEAGVNHNGDRRRALDMVDAATQCGVDAVKFQTFRADEVATRAAPKAAYQERFSDPAESQFDMLRRLELDLETHRELMDRCGALGIEFMSTPFSSGSADMLDMLKVSVFKVPSGELTNLPLLHHIAKKGKPTVVSTGMADLGEVRQAVRVFRRAGNEALALLHCVSNYPAAPADVNLRAMRTMEREFGVPVGYSDHTTGIEIALASVALGACILEKHFTLDRGLPGPDHHASLEPGEFREMVRSIRAIEEALGDGRKAPAASEYDVARAARRSLVAACDIPGGAILTQEMIAVKRPGTGLSPSMLDSVLGRRAAVDVAEGTLLRPDHLSADP